MPTTTTLTPELAASRAAGAALQRTALLHEQPLAPVAFVYSDPEDEACEGSGCCLYREGAELLAGPPGSSLRASVRPLLMVETQWGRVFMVRDIALIGSGTRLRGATKGEVLAYLFANMDSGEKPGDFRIVRAPLSGLTVALPCPGWGLRERAEG